MKVEIDRIKICIKLNSIINYKCFKKFQITHLNTTLNDPNLHWLDRGMLNFDVVSRKRFCIYRVQDIPPHREHVRASASKNAILFFFTISKSNFIAYTIPFYNSSHIKKFYFY